MTRYPIEIFWYEPDSGYIAIAPDLPGCSAFGETPEGAATEIQDAIAAWIEACEAADDPVPLPTMRMAA